MAVAVTKSGRWSALWAVGMLLMFVGERMIASGRGRAVATVAGVLAVLVPMAVRFLRAGNTTPDRAKVERTLLALYGVALLAIILYVCQSDLWTSLFDKPLEKNWPRLSTALSALWPAIWLTAAWPVLLVELAYAQIARAPRLELSRIRDAMLSGFGMASALVFAFALAYAASERDTKFDLAYFRTTRPGEVTRRIVRNLDQPIEVAVFFPSGNEVREEVDNYLADLGRESGQLTVTHFDYDIDPIKAKEYGVSSNGALVFVRGKRHEQLGLPREIETARNALKTLDKEIQQRLMMVVKPPRMVAFTQGHGERTVDKPEGENDKRPGVKILRDMLIDQTYDTRSLSVADGLGQEIPKDITVVMVIGPQKPFLPEEYAALNKYIDNGGRVLIALDPENKVDMHEVLGPLQLSYKPEMLANDQVFARKTHQDGDRVNLVTATFSSHPSVTTLARMGGRAPVIQPRAGGVNTTPQPTPPIPVDSPIKAHHTTFLDKNGNLQPDPGEDRRSWELGATAIKKDARVFLLADSDCLADEAIRAGANELMAIDIAHWLMGDESFSGVASTETDVPLSHTRKQDVVWFYSTIFLAPALVIATGVRVTRRRKAKKKLAAKAPAAPTPPGAAS